MDADRIIAAAEKAAADYMQRTGGNSAVGSYHQLGSLKHELRKAYELLAQANNPPGCEEVEAYGITAGALPIVNDDRELDGWMFYIGGQCVDHVLDRKVLDALCDVADGQAAVAAQMGRESRGAA